MKETLMELERLRKHYKKSSDIEFDAGVSYGIKMSMSVIKAHLKKIMGDSYIDVYGKDPLFR